MARSHSTDGKGAWTNPEVRFERADVEYPGVVIFGVALAGGTAVIVAAMFGLGLALLRDEGARKGTDLPPAAVDADILPPEPRLEGAEDVRQRKVRLYPPRAEEFLGGQREVLEKGDPKKSIEPIGEAIDALAGKLPAQKGKEAPTGFGPRLPSKSSSGRRTTGGS
jgi:hypothetical protein